MENSEPEQAVLCNHVRLPLVRPRHQLRHKTLRLLSILIERCTGAMEVEKLGEWPTNDWFNLWPKPWERSHAQHCLDGPGTGDWIAQKPMKEYKSIKWFLMIFLYMHRLMSAQSSTERFLLAADGSRWRDLQPNVRWGGSPNWKSPSNPFSQSLETPLKRGRKNCRSWRGQGNQENLVQESTKTGS